MSKRTTFLLLAALATTLTVSATAQDLDLVLTSVDIEVSGTEYRLSPNISLINGGNTVDHLLDIATYYGPILVQEASSIVNYFHNNHTCWTYSDPNCGSGECMDLYSFSATLEGTCHDASLFFFCACKYELVHTLEWVQWTGEPTVTIRLDPYNVVQEADETNNEITISLEPVANNASTWSTLKSLYR